MSDFLFWLIVSGMAIFAALRLWWIYRRGVGQVFWQTRHAQKFYMGAAAMLVGIALAIFLSAQYWPLLVAIPAIYVLLAFTAVKVDERGIMANAVFARWQDILRLHHDETGGYIIVTTHYSWRRIKLRVPTEKFNDFKKMLAAKGMALQPLQEQEEESVA